ncbi:hypothetical protein E2542_SST06211 [Spatholobus suberectus]|nr:hypothetical protein E2542_SST06211 [Spatholobus suberectus]
MRRLQLPPELPPQGDGRRGGRGRAVPADAPRAPPPPPRAAAAVRGVLPDAGWVPARGGAAAGGGDAGAAVDVRRRRDAEHEGGPGGRFEPECRRDRVQEEVQDQVHAGTEGQDARIGRKTRLEDSETR